MSSRTWPIAMALAAAVSGCGTVGGQARREVATLEPLFQTGTDERGDTLLLMPYRVYTWRDRVVVIDLKSRIAVFDTLGHVMWVRGREGRGPGEIREPSAVATAPNGDLWVLDPGNMKILAFDTAGAVTAEFPIANLPFMAVDLVVLRDQVLFFAPRREHNLVRASLPDFQPGTVETLPWADSIPDRSRIVLSAAADAGGTAWAAAHQFGGLFYVGNESAPPSAFLYVEPVPFQGMFGIRVKPGGGIDASAVPEHVDFRYGAKQIAWAGSELFMLFGGRPPASGQEAEPSRYIDVYSSAGKYLRSHRMPFDADAMATSDGQRFFVLRSDPYPMLVGLRIP